jgi:hypothetical protein
MTLLWTERTGDKGWRWRLRFSDGLEIEYRTDLDGDDLFVLTNGGSWLLVDGSYNLPELVDGNVARDYLLQHAPPRWDAGPPLTNS